jgi:spermidine synthase
VNCLLGLLILAGMDGGRRRFVVPAAAVVALLTLIGARSLPERIDFRGGTLASLLVPKLLFEEEGDLATVQVRADPRRLENRAMVIDGSVIASSRDLLADQYRKQVMLAHLPMVLDREIRRTLSVGLASSSTLAASSRYPWVTDLDAVEISAAVLEGARYFDESAVLDDPRTSVHIEDAVHFLLRNPGRYDLIISDGKQNAEFSGNARMLSREFYEYSLASLTSCGIFIQWIPITTLPDDFEIVLRTLLSVFSKAEIFYEPPNSIYMVASQCSLHDREKLAKDQATELGVFDDLEQDGSKDPRDLLAGWIASADQVRKILPDGPMNRSDRMLLEFSSYRNRPTSDRQASENLALLLEARDTAPAAAGMALAPPTSPVVRWSRTLQLAQQRALEGKASEAVRLALQVLREQPDHRAARAALARFRVK